MLATPYTVAFQGCFQGLIAEWCASSHKTSRTSRDVESIVRLPSTTTPTSASSSSSSYFWRSLVGLDHRHTVVGLVTTMDHRPRHLWARRDAWSLCRILPRGRAISRGFLLESRRFPVSLHFSSRPVAQTRASLDIRSFADFLIDDSLYRDIGMCARFYISILNLLCLRIVT